MSIYRDKFHDELHTFRSGNEPVASRRQSTGTVAESAEDQEAYKHLRKTTPVDTPLPRTLTWVASLPPAVRPVALLRQYPRIANLIAAAWGDAKAFGTYMDSLLTDKRGKRRGFPEDVLRELSALALHYSQDTLGRRQG